MTKPTARIQRMIDSGQGFAVIGNPPESLTSSEAKAWKDIISHCHSGVLRQSDSAAVELSAILYSKIKNGTAIADDKKNLHSLLYQMGISKQQRIKMGL